MSELVTNPLILSAILVGLATSFVGGIIGSYVVIKRIVFICGSISHSVLAGIGFCLWLQRGQGIEWAVPLYGALISGIISALAIGWIKLHYHQREDSVISAIWSLGMALGVIFISLTPGYNVELTNYLLGNILWVSSGDLYTLLSLDLLVLLVVFLFHNRFIAICFDEKQAYLQGVSVHAVYLLLLVLTAISIVLLIHVVGVLLVLTILTLPASLANLFTVSIKKMMLMAVVLSSLFCISGIALSFQLDLPAGGTIALLAGSIYVITLVAKLDKKRFAW